MGIRRFAKFSRNARAFACVCNGWPSPKARHFDDRARSPLRADDPDRPRLLHDNLFALSISAPLPVAARLVVGPDGVGNVGVGNERYDAMAPSLNGVGTEVDGRHSKSSPGPRFRLRAAPSPLNGTVHSSRAPTRPSGCASWASRGKSHRLVT